MFKHVRVKAGSGYPTGSNLNTPRCCCTCGTRSPKLFKADSLVPSGALLAASSRLDLCGREERPLLSPLVTLSGRHGTRLAVVLSNEIFDSISGRKEEIPCLCLKTVEGFEVPAQAALGGFRTGVTEDIGEFLLVT